MKCFFLAMVSLQVSNCWKLKKCQVLPASVVPINVVKGGVVVPDDVAVDGCNVVKEIVVATPSLQQSAPEGKSFGQLSTPQKRLPKHWLSESQSPSSTSHGF